MGSPAPRQPPGLTAATRTAKEAVSPPLGHSSPVAGLSFRPCGSSSRPPAISPLRLAHPARPWHLDKAQMVVRPLRHTRHHVGLPSVAVWRLRPKARGRPRHVPASSEPCGIPAAGGRGRCAARLGAPAPPGRLHPCGREVSPPARASQGSRTTLTQNNTKIAVKY